MKTNAQLLLLLISLSFFSCNSAVKNQAAPISNIDTDFPITEELEFTPFNKFDILEIGGCMITLYCGLSEEEKMMMTSDPVII